MPELTGDSKERLRDWIRLNFAEVHLDLLGQQFAIDSDEQSYWGEEWERLDDWRLDAARETYGVVRDKSIKLIPRHGPSAGPVLKRSRDELMDAGYNPDSNDDVYRYAIKRCNLEVEDYLHGFPFAWSTCWVSYNWEPDDHPRTQRFIAQAANAGFLVYQFRDHLILGVDGGGYDFLDTHFAPLYEACSGKQLERR